MDEGGAVAAGGQQAGAGDPDLFWAVVPNAVAGREGAYSGLGLGALLPGIAEQVPAAGARVLEALRPWAPGTSLLDFLGDATTPERVAPAWTPEVHRRLMTVERAVDPQDLFRSGHALGRPA